MMTRAQMFDKAQRIAQGRNGNICYKVIIKQGRGMTGMIVSIMFGNDGRLRDQAIMDYIVNRYSNRVLDIEEYSLVEDMLEDENGRTE